MIFCLKNGNSKLHITSNLYLELELIYYYHRYFLQIRKKDVSRFYEICDEIKDIKIKVGQRLIYKMETAILEINHYRLNPNRIFMSSLKLGELNFSIEDFSIFLNYVLIYEKLLLLK
jgi:hypothetical protein